MTTTWLATGAKKPPATEFVLDPTRRARRLAAYAADAEPMKPPVRHPDGTYSRATPIDTHAPVLPGGAGQNRHAAASEARLGTALRGAAEARRVSDQHAQPRFPRGARAARSGRTHKRKERVFIGTPRHRQFAGNVRLHRHGRAPAMTGTRCVRLGSGNRRTVCSQAQPQARRLLYCGCNSFRDTSLQGHEAIDFDGTDGSQGCRCAAALT